MDASSLRAEFPVLETARLPELGHERAAGEEAVEAAQRRAAARARRRPRAARTSNGKASSPRAARRLRAALGCDASRRRAHDARTSEGIAQTISGLALAPGDEILTSDEEHPGLLGALGGARELRGVSVREVPLPAIAEAVGPRTRLVACSHVGWASGLHRAAELAQLDVPVLLDGAQGVGAVAVDVRALGCDAYAGAGQKWLCGPDGTGMLYVSPALRERLTVARRGYANLADPDAGARRAPARRRAAL